MHANHPIVDLAAVTQPLTPDTDGIITALGNPGFVEEPECLGVCMLLGHDLLTAIT